MKYFLDTEFIEGWRKPIKWLPTIGDFNKPYHSVQLISIGIVCEDGRHYYAIGSEYDYEDANDWVKGHVINPMYCDNIAGFKREHIKVETFHKSIGLPLSQIAFEILQFIHEDENFHASKWLGSSDDYYRLMHSSEERKAEFYAYYADYDWVVFCSIFGTMMDLPKSFPMYCRDLKQTVDELCWNSPEMKEFRFEYSKNNGEQPTLKTCLDIFKAHAEYPKQENEHNALDDAKWNFDLYKFLFTL